MTEKKAKSTKAKATKIPTEVGKETGVNERHAGFVAIIGAPNAGKSTLLNHLIGQKISIVSPKAQTTRMRVLGVMTEADTQIGFVDTPGIFDAKRRLDLAMVRAAWNSLQDADVTVLMVDAADRLDDSVTAIIDELKIRKRRVVLVLNKVDKINPDKMLPLAAQLNETGIVEQIFMISALKGDGVDDLKKYLLGKMPVSPWFFEEDQLTDLSSQLLAAEMTREQLYRQLQQELPYAATVIPESWETKKDGSSVVRQRIIVSRAGHKPIILGSRGSRIKSISLAARLDMERLLGHKVHLFLEVGVDEKWQERPEFYRMFGLDFNAK